MRGDGPIEWNLGAHLMLFSPRAWGWSDDKFCWMCGAGVLPTCVGMVRPATLLRTERARSPHVRGDGPLRCLRRVEGRAFSPRAWGWSAFALARHVHAPVLPTCVGMVRPSNGRSSRNRRSPHVRGDGPCGRKRQSYKWLFSPRAWGWSAPPLSADGPGLVLPTCVGMVRGGKGVAL